MLDRRTFVGSGAAALAALSARRLAAAFDGDPRFMPSADEVWAGLERMVRLGPRHTGSDAHRKFVDSVAADMQSSGLQITSDAYTLPRWDARRWGITATARGAAPVEIPVASYYPYSGQTSKDGVAAPLLYAGSVPSDGSKPPNLADANGKIVFLDYPIVTRHYEEWFKPWGFHTSETTLGPVLTSIIAVAAPQLADFKKAGAVGVIIGFTNISDGHAAGQYLPFGRALQDIPTLWVGRDAGTRLRTLAERGATVTLTLEADVFPGTKTDTVIGTLPGSTDEVIVVNTHTDGPNAIEENGPVALVALATYFSKIPKSSRKRTLVFLQASGHFAGAYVPAIRGFLQQHDDIVKKTVAAITVEHLGCREWLDDAPMKRYAATGKDELSNAITDSPEIARLTLESLKGTADRRVAVVKPTPKGRWMGEGGALSRAGVPTLGYIPAPTYLCMMADDGCLSKLSKPLFHAQITALAALIQKLDAAPRESLTNT